MRSRCCLVATLVLVPLEAIPGCGGDSGNVPPPDPLTGVTAIATGGSHACALLVDGTARCWGTNLDYELGSGQQTIREPQPVAVQGLSGVSALAVGGDHTCALLNDATVDCWGNEAWGELGNGTIAFDQQPAPGAVAGLTGVVALAARGADRDATVDFADEFSCALASGGTVECWGQNEAGELGTGSISDSGLNAVSTPGPVVGLAGAIAIGIGNEHACAVLDGGGVACWGQNIAGQLGNGAPTAPSPSLLAVVGLSGPAVAVAGGSLHTCALLADGTVECWGANNQGELGNGTTSDALAPTAVSGLAGITAITAGSEHTCALRGDGTVWCWGQSSRGQLGDGSTSLKALVPVKAVGLTNVVAVSAGQNFTCALVTGGTVACWGSNSSGQLGNGSTSESRTATPVTLPRR